MGKQLLEIPHRKY